MTTQLPPTRTVQVHSLKVWPQFYKELVTGQKTFEIRKDDRAYQVGDYLLLCEFNPDTGAFTGATVARKVTALVRDFAGIEPGYVVMSIKPRRLP